MTIVNTNRPPANISPSYLYASDSIIVEKDEAGNICVIRDGHITSLSTRNSQIIWDKSTAIYICGDIRMVKIDLINGRHLHFAARYLGRNPDSGEPMFGTLSF